MTETGKPITLITGASSGIGAALAQRLARYGDHVILVARRLRLLQEVAAQITKAGGSCEISVCDVTVVASTAEPIEPDHHLVWLPQREALDALTPPSHRWAVAEWLADRGVTRTMHGISRPSSG